MMEFHIARKARERYQFAETLFSYSGNVVFANVAACREFAHRINTVREVEKHPEQAIHSGQLYAMGLIDEASHVLMARYREQFDPAVMTSALDWFADKVGAESLGRMLLSFVEQFPGASVMSGQETPWQWLGKKTGGVSHWAVALEELLLLWTANRNQAFQPFEELFEEKSLAEKTVYLQVTKRFPEYFATRPLIPLPGIKPMNLLDLLCAPAVGSPRSLSAQLALIRTLWKPMLGDSLEHHLQIADEILHEEELAIWMQFNPSAVQAKAAAEAAERRRRENGQQRGPSVVASAEVPVFGDPAHEYEKFSADTAWMPTTVLIAKSTYVWLAQMSKHYGRAITKLDEIPDEELALLAHRGLNSLWLIGVWERSRASKTIKQLCGNSDAVASAYSLFDYAISEDLGGEAAYTNLRDRAYRHGIRLASDMVPNHMGIDSPWVVEHPEWFISRPDSPYPAYSFNGPDLSHDGRVEIKIEDHYFEQSDAAVVFRRRDRQSGETRFIYHGNDGTSFPWNDTAQLDYMNAAVREQVIQTILHVARLFPVIRFDAAMTLAKRHFHRLWFPGPGASGAIPSRAEYGMSQAEFDRAMPHEFWREVVDRVAAEVPGTLLLAEAFWLMEGYFVRTLGMHRVYNSAFMVMLRDEENAKYREVIKKTIEFDPDILKRYVNFMSNPDERTAIDQFGKGDKCFGVTTMMATLPGLPMFGHGQVEGFTEKYGMEYQRPRYDESPDHWLVERHEREIAPLLERRQLFAESGNFRLYDFYLDSGKVDENVFAYSNRRGDERALVVFNNRYGETHGTIDYSAAYADKGAGQLRQQRMREGLGLTDNASAVLAWRDSLTGLEYLRRASDLSERGLTLDLHAYQCHVLLDWRELYSTREQPWDRLSDQLNGRGVASLDDALVNLELQPAHDSLRELLDSDNVRRFAALAEHPRTLAVGVNTEIEAERTEFFEAAWTRCENFLRQAQAAYCTLTGSAQPPNPSLLRAAYRQRMRAAMRIPAVEALFPAPWTVAARSMLPSPSPQLTATAMWGPVLAWCVLELLAKSIDPENSERVALDLFDRLRLREPFALAFAALGFEGEEAWRVAARIKVGLLTEARVGQPQESAAQPEATAVKEPGLSLDSKELKGAEALAPEEILPGILPVAISPALWLDADVRWLTGVHQAEGHDYLERERYEELLWWLLMPSLLRMADETVPSHAAVLAMSKAIMADLETAEATGYRVDLLLTPATAEAASEEPATKAEAVVESAPELIVASEAVTDAEPLLSEEPKSAEPVPTEPEPETAVESKPEAVQEEPSSFAEEPAPVEPEVESVAEPVAELTAESEAGAESEPLLAEEPKPAEPASTEPEIEVAAESGPEAAHEELPTFAEEPAPVEPEVESVAEPVAELTAEIEPVIESEPLPAEEPEPAVPEPTEPKIEAVSEPEPEAAHEEPSSFTEELALAKPEIEPVAEPAAEIEPEPEAAPLTAALPAFAEPEPAEPVIEAVPVLPADFESVLEASETAAEEAPLYGSQPELVEPVIPAAHPLPPQQWEPVEPVIEAVAEPVNTASDFTGYRPAEAEVPADPESLIRWLLKPGHSTGTSDSAAHEEQFVPIVNSEPAEPEMEAAAEPSAEFESAEDEYESAVEEEPVAEQELAEPEAEEAAEDQETASESSESDFHQDEETVDSNPLLRWIKTVPSTAANFFSNREEPLSLIGKIEPDESTVEAAESTVEPAEPMVEPAESKIEPEVEPKPDVVEKRRPAFIEPWEPPAPKIEYSPKPVSKPPNPA